MEIYAVFGNPILHSKSPQLFNHSFQALNIEAFYTRIRPLSGADLTSIILKLNISGANITTPFKEDVVEYLNDIDADALAINGVNTILNRSGKLIGFNTDHIGVTRSILEAGIKIKGSDVLVLGAGPAAAAAAYGLRNQGANVYLANRTTEKALKTSKKLNVEHIQLNELNKHINHFDAIVSALLPDANPLEGLKIPEGITLLDANYRLSVLSDYVRGFGCKVISGKRWLIHQAMASFKIFTGMETNVQLMDDAFEKKIDRNSLKAEWLQRLGSEITEHHDILISATSENEYKQMLNEEISKTFGC